MKDAPLHTALDRLMLESLPYVAAGLAVMNVVLTLTHVSRLPGRTHVWMLLATTAMVLALLALLSALRRGRVPQRWAQAAGGAMAGGELALALLYQWLQPEPHLTTNLILVIAGSGFLLLSRSWLLTMVIASLAVWVFIVSSGPRSPVWFHYGVALFEGTLLSVLVHVIRVRNLLNLEQRKIELEQALHERERMEAQLLQADRMAAVGTLAAGVAHEINNPLAYIQANLEYVAGEIEAHGLDGEVRQAMEEVRQGTQRVSAIVRDLKTFSRGHKDKREPVDVRAVLESVLAMAQNEIRHRARLEREMASVPPVEANESRLAQVFLNLVLNAAQAIPEGQADKNVIRVRTGTDAAGRVVVTVEDSGSGIPPENLRRIFDPFFTTKPVGIGTGLGLSICTGIVQSLGGEIAVDSAVGRGSTFRVQLPASKGELPPVAVPAQKPHPPPAHARAQVLVVDDEPRIGTSIQRTLHDHDIVSVATGHEALSRVQNGGAFDLILCDVMMPEMSGAEFFDRLRAISPALCERVVFMTGGAFTQSAADFLRSVPNRRLEKPFDARALRALVASS